MERRMQTRTRRGFLGAGVLTAVAACARSLGDDGAVVRLKQGDCVVQNGTRHAWRNSKTAPCVMAFVLVGAARDGRSG